MTPTWIPMLQLGSAVRSKARPCLFFFPPPQGTGGRYGGIVLFGYIEPDPGVPWSTPGGDHFGEKPSHFALCFGDDFTTPDEQAVAASQTIREVLQEEEMDKMIGFTLIMFEFGEGGSLAYVSTAERDDFLRVLDEMRGKLAASLPNTPKGE